MIGDHLPGEPGKVKEVKVGRGSAKVLKMWVQLGKYQGIYQVRGSGTQHLGLSFCFSPFRECHNLGGPSVWFVTALCTAVFIMLGQLTDIMTLSYCLQSGHHNACVPSSVYILQRSRELSFI